MSDVISLANQIAATKENIRQAIEDRGVDIPVTTPLTDYPAKIAAINTENVASDVYLIDENYDSSTTDLVMAGNYGVIADNAFARQSNLQTVDLSYVHAIGNGTFNGCSNLTSVSGDHLKYIGDDAFKNTGLTTFNNTHVKYVGNDAFENSAVSSVNIPNCEIVKGGAFMQTDNLETVNMDSVRNIPGECFYGCNILNSVSANFAKSIGAFAFLQAGNGAYTTYGTTYTLSFPEVQTVSMESFYHVNGLTSINLPKCISIGHDAFNACQNLATITIPKVQSIGSGTFNNTNAIYTLNIPECTSIGSYNFYDNNHRLNEVTVADGCVIDTYCFKDGATVVNGKIARINDYGFASYLNANIIIDIDFSEITYIGKSCFRNPNNGHRIEITSGIVDLKNCITLGTSTNSSNSECVFNIYNSDGNSNVKKVWLNKDCTILPNYSRNLSIFNQSTCHIYTNAESKPSGWSNICTSATWHFGATHEEFEKA